jgi:RNA polymerase sigma factor (sigma-70 family)
VSASARADGASDPRDPDADVVRRIGEGDERAMRALVDRHIGRMLQLAKRMLGDETEAEDVAQEVFTRAWRMAPKWRPGEAKFETWMHRVALNLCYDRLRRRREVVTDQIPERVDDGPTPFDAAHASDVAARVDRAVQALPERQRAAITLCAYQELTNIEAAAVLEVSVEALESLLSRARRTLRATLEDEAAALLESAGAGTG